MNASEGLRRIATVVRWIGVGLGGVALLIGVGAALSTVVDYVSCVPVLRMDGSTHDCRPRLGDALGAAGAGLAVAAFFVLGARATAWIIDGFAAPR